MKFTSSQPSRAHCNSTIIYFYQRKQNLAQFVKVLRYTVFCLPACLPPSLPDVSSTSGRSQILSHNTEYQCANTDLLFRLRFIHWVMVSPFILPCFPFSFTGEWKGEKFLKRCRWIVWLILLHHANGQIHMSLIASSLKIVNKWNVLPCTDSSQPGWFHVQTYMYVLGVWFDNTADTKIKHIWW